MSPESRRSNFKKLRKQLNVSQRKVSIDLGVSENHIRNIESGRGNPDIKLLFKMAMYYRKTAEELFPDLVEEAMSQTKLKIG
ncbi:anaerobic benzoate catabolism transcriptional regulator [Desulfosporosinus acididurans]|uniref:Anaerobic benzoate catabolism transcriptional regulator n=1 Tax=Desulfosporosinus acididurans TaxID=476652 RepID=A0A0J1FS72_9FIRM|nr:helix-turn-helix transcriptional regulator [Desulfosporosinus acididurans]KLU66345.1 anaerobic benzoate catabolism transcriptional regulator [Desulfosporosinus acididurans]